MAGKMPRGGYAMLAPGILYLAYTNSLTPLFYN